MIFSRQKQQLQELVAWRSRDAAPYLIASVSSLDVTALWFPEALAQILGDENCHYGTKKRGLDNATMNEISHDGFISIFSHAPGHRGAIGTDGLAPKVGIGFAQDPLTGAYYRDHHFANK